MPNLSHAVGFFVFLFVTTSSIAQEFPGEKSTWYGFDRYDFTVDQKPVVVVTPRIVARGRPWVWHGEFFGHKPAPDIALLKRGFHVVYMRVPDMLGSPTAVQHWNAFYEELTGKYRFAPKVALVGLSRGGLYCYNWAAANPDRVACIYGDAPVCDFKSWPGGKGKGEGSARDWQLVLERFNFANDAEAIAYDKNPVDNLEGLAKAGVPLLHVYGDADKAVPWEENTGVLADRYRKLGGSIELIAKPGVGHHPHGLDDSTPIVEFIARHAGPREIDLETDSVDKDYSRELVRTLPKSPSDALQTFALADGFRMEIAAAEPLVADPTAISFDELGRMYVVQMNGYSEDPDDNLGVIRQLTDTDGDGRYDQATDYIRGLSWPTAVACYDGGLFVAAAPDIIYCKDTNGDGRSDERRVLFTGFGRQNVQGLLNSFQWGLDGKLYGSASSNGGNITTTGEDGELILRRRDFRIDPQSMTMEAISGGGQHGLSFDRWGERFVTSNSNHLQWVEYDDRYASRNPLLEVPSPTRNIAVDGPAAEVYRTSPVEPWREVRTRLRIKQMVGGPVEGGGRAAGYFTGATGVTIYTGDAYPASWHDNSYAVIGDVGGNLIHLKRIDQQQLDLVARRVHTEREFVTSTDNWFRPVQFANGPDGALYVIDMYRETIEHPLSLPPVIKKHLDLTSGRDRGRIYRVVPEGYVSEKRALPGGASRDELMAMLGHENGWHRETAARLLIHSSHGVANLDLRKRFRDEPTEDGRLHILYCLAACESLDPTTLVAAMIDQHPIIRVHAIRLAEGQLADARWRDSLTRLARDEDVRVRYQLALSIGELPWDQRFEHLCAISEQGIDSDKMQYAVLTSVADGRIPFLKYLLAFGKDDDDHSHRPLIVELCRQIGRAGTGIHTAFAVVEESSNGQEFANALLSGIDKRGQQLVVFLSSKGIEQADTTVHGFLDDAKDLLSKRDLSSSSQIMAIAALRFAEWPDVHPTLEHLLQANQPSDVQDKAVEVVGSYREDAAAETLASVVDSLAPAARRRALDLLCSRKQWSMILLERVQQNASEASSMGAFHRNQLVRHADDQVRSLATSLFGQTSDRARILEEHQDVLKLGGNLDHGREIFRKTCATCHRLEGVGQNVGPDLQPLRNRGAEFMLTNILDPNREVDARFEAYTLLDSAGMTLTGIISSETEDSILILAPDGKSHSRARDEIEQLRSTGLSLMPDGMERELNQAALADLIAYLICE